MKNLLLAACVLLLLCPALALAQDPPKTDTVNITGTWDLQIDTPDGKANVTATYKQEGEKLTGTQTGPMDSPASPLEGTVKGADVKYSITIDMGGQQGTITFTAKVSGDALTGTFDLGGMGGGNFTGKKR
jgi:hypothetical protein